MTELNDDEASILAQARRGLGPTSADEQRVLQRLLPQLALAPSVPNALGPSWALRAAGAVAVIAAVALSGGLGYRKGFDAGIAQQNQTRAQTNAVLVGSLASVQPKLELAPPSPLPPEHSRPSVTKAWPGPSAARTRGEPSAMSASSAAVAPPGLDEEVRQLRRVERAIRESNPRLALVLLDDLDHVLPAGQLLEERRAASIMANCQLSADAARADAREFVAKHAASAYLTRVTEICGLGNERNSAAPGTHVPR